MAVTRGVPTVAWVLECGCDPHIEHCGQCDERRAVRSRYNAVTKLLDALVKAEVEGLVKNVAVSEDDPICVMEMEVHPDVARVFDREPLVVEPITGDARGDVKEHVTDLEKGVTDDVS
jgi:hypothetical protein